MVEVEITFPALEDIQSIVDYVSRQSVLNAEKVSRQIFQKIGSLKTFPERGQIVREINRKHIREIKVFSYRIIYQIADKVSVLTVHHSSRLLTNNPYLKDFFL